MKKKTVLFVANYSSASVAVVKIDGNGIPETVTDSILYVSEAKKFRIRT